MHINMKNTKVLKKILVALFLFFTTTLLAQQTFQVRGFVYSEESGESAGYIKVVLKPMDTSSQVTTKVSMTNSDGFFQFTGIAKGTYYVALLDLQYEKKVDTIHVGATKITTLRYELKKKSNVKKFEGVSVYGKKQAARVNVDMSVNQLDKKSIERLPSFGAENDIVAAFKVTPGVVSTGDQGGQLYVRGGTPIQNKVMLDGMTIYNPFHSIGFFSVFETDLIKSADIYTGGYPAQYGGRISSIMDIKYRDGNLNHQSGMVSGSPFMGKVVLEGPIYKNKDVPGAGVSYVLSAKHSLLKYDSKTIYPYVNDGQGLPFAFTDAYGKITVKSQGGSKFSVFGFTNNDAVNYTDIADLHWNAYGGGLNFSLVPQKSPMLIKGHLNGSGYKILFKEKSGQQPRSSSIAGFNLGFDFIYFLKHHSQLSYGLKLSGLSTKFKTYNELDRVMESNSFNTQLSVYLDYRLVKGLWVINPGVRLQAYPGLSSVVPEPRLGIKYNVTENFRLKLSGGRYSQNLTATSSDQDIVTLFYGFLSAPTNVQSSFTQPNGKTKDPRNGIQMAWHGIFGVEYDLTKHLTLNVEGYYKYYPKLSNINTNKLYPDTKDFSEKPDIYKKDFLIESGYSYGADVLLKYQNKRLFLWGTYSYGKTLRWDGFDYYVPVFDRRHTVNLVGTYQFLKDKSLEVSLRWSFGSGLPFTPTAGYYQGEDFSDGITTDYTTSNSSKLSILYGDMDSKRLPTYHRFDITIKKKFEFKNKTKLELRLGVTNVYNRNNIFYVNRVSNEKIYQLPILPSFGMSYKW